MRASRAEIKIEEILAQANLPFVEEYAFPDLTGFRGDALRFDFAVLDDDGQVDFLIEYQGIQHYIAKSKFGGASGLRKQQVYDLRKRQYCKAHNITLVIIPYWEQNLINYDYIMKAAGY